MATIMTAPWLTTLTSEDRVSVKPQASRCSTPSTVFWAG